MKNLIFSHKGIPGWTWSMNDIWKMWNFPLANHFHKLIEVIWHMDNGQFSYNKRGTKNENFNNCNFVFYSIFLYEVGLTYEILNILI